MSHIFFEIFFANILYDADNNKNVHSNVFQFRASTVYPVDTQLKLNVHKTLRRHSGRLLNVLCTFNLRPVSTGIVSLRNDGRSFKISETFQSFRSPVFVVNKCAKLYTNRSYCGVLQSFITETYLGPCQTSMMELFCENDC